MILFDSAAPKIDRTTLKDLNVKAGQHIRFDVKVSGEPPATKTWFHNKARLETKDEVTVSYPGVSSQRVLLTKILM